MLGLRWFHQKTGVTFNGDVEKHHQYPSIVELSFFTLVPPVTLKCWTEQGAEKKQELFFLFFFFFFFCATFLFGGSMHVYKCMYIYIYIYIYCAPENDISEPKKSLNVKGQSSEPNLIFSGSTSWYFQGCMIEKKYRFNTVTCKKTYNARRVGRLRCFSFERWVGWSWDSTNSLRAYA